MEDVQFLKERAIEESYLFVVDSSKRDKYAYPSPSEYTIQFNGPFRNVLGIELLDASIPRTEYVIDESCNTLVYSIDGGTRKTLTVSPGDYNLLQFSEVLTTMFEGGVAAEPLSTPYSQTSRLKFKCSFPFTFYLHESSMRRQLGFAGTEKTYTSDLTQESTTARSFQGPFPGFDVHRIEPGSVLRQAFVPTTSGPLHSLVIYIDEETSGDVDVSVVDGSGTVYGTAVISPSGPSEVEVMDATETLLENSTYYIVMQSSDGADIFVNAPNESSEFAQIAATPSGPWSDQTNSVSCEAWVSIGRHELISPHLVDLTGVRYVMVRCPEIETYLYRERAYEPFYAGLGMVKLGGNGVREQRFDFVSFPPRSLNTPLGKLSSLTFKLEKPDGTIYNSRGIDHSLLLVLRYYSGLKATSTIEQQRILNPEYTPIPIQFLENTAWKREVNTRDTMDAWARNSSSSS